MARVLPILALLLLATPGVVAARQVTAEIVTGEQPETVRALGADGLYVPGQGLDVSRQEALARLGPLPSGACGSLQRCPFELFVSVPPLGSQPNTQRYDVTILGGSYRGILVSDRTRIPGLVTIADIRETVAALEEGTEPPIRSESSADPLAELERLDRRLEDARTAQLPATVALTLILVALAAATFVMRSGLVASTALLYPLAAISLALGAASLDRVGPTVTTAVVVAAAPLALAAARYVPIHYAVALFLGAYGIALAASPETNSLMALGPHPWGGGRFYGVTNLIATLMLAPVLAAATVVRGAARVVLGFLALVVVGVSATGADGGGLIVFATALVTLWFLLERSRLTPLAIVVAGAVALAVVGLDAASGGSSHVVDAVAGGPGELAESLERRARISVDIATSSPWQLAVLLAGLGILGWVTTLRPRLAAVDALLVALLVSLVVNDSPTKVAGYGAVVCVALRAWCVSNERPVGIESAT